MEGIKYSYNEKTRESLSIAIYNTGYQACTPGHTWGPGVRDHYLLHYVQSGIGHYYVDGRCHKLERGQAFLVYPDTLVQYQADDENPWEYCWVGFNGSEAKLIMGQTPFSTKHPICNLDEGFYRQLMNIYEARGQGNANQMRMIGYLYVFLSQLVELSDQKASEDPSLEYVKVAIRYINYNYARRIEVSEIAAAVGISRSHLYRMFILHLGLSPNEYLTRFRIDQACNLLKQPGLLVSNVSSSVGFEDQMYFSRVFKKIMGCSPTAYQRTNREKNMAVSSV